MASKKNPSTPKVNQERLQEIINSSNVIDTLDLDDDKLRDIAEDVLDGLDMDEESMKDWLDDANQAMELTELKRDEKNWPFPGAANIKSNAISLAVTQFTSRTLPELIKNGEVVKYKIIGADLDGAKQRKGDRVKNYLNYQVLELIPNWLDERDRLLNQLAVVGTCFVKSWWDPRINEVCSEVIKYDLIKINNNAESLEKAPRITQYFYLTKREVLEFMRWELWSDIDLKFLQEDGEDEDCDDHEFIEQHCWLNLLNEDECDYPQPYIVTVHKHSRKVLRIVARFNDAGVHFNSKGRIKSIDPIHYFSDYHFMPSPRKQFLSIGFGTLMLDNTLMQNSLLNQMINAGSLSMIQGGIYNKECGIRPDDFTVEPGEWIPADTPLGTDLKGAFFPFTYNPPSSVTLELYNILSQQARELTSSTEALTGMQDGTNVSPNTIYAIIQQGLKVFVAIQRRIMRGYKKELSKIVQLNAEYLPWEKYFSVIDVRPEEAQECFTVVEGKEPVFSEWKMQNVDVVPVTDLAVSSEAESLSRVNAGINMFMQVGQISPEAQQIINLRELLRDGYKALNYQNVDAIINPPAPPGPDLNAIKLQSELDMNAKSLELEARKVEIELRKLYLEELKVKQEGVKSQAQSIKHLADAEAVDKNAQISAYKVMLDSMTKQQEIDLKKTEKGPNGAKYSIGEQPEEPDFSGLPSKEEVMQMALSRGYTQNVQ